MKKIPLWVVASIGQDVIIESEFKGADQVFPAGSKGFLAGLMTGDGGSIHAVVALDPKDPTYFENLQFSEIHPVPMSVTFTLDLEEGFMLTDLQKPFA